MWDVWNRNTQNTSKSAAEYIMSQINNSISHNICKNHTILQTYLYKKIVKALNYWLSVKGVVCFKPGFRLESYVLKYIPNLYKCFLFPACGLVQILHQNYLSQCQYCFVAQLADGAFDVKTSSIQINKIHQNTSFLEGGMVQVQV